MKKVYCKRSLAIVLSLVICVAALFGFGGCTKNANGPSLNEVGAISNCILGNAGKAAALASACADGTFTLEEVQNNCKGLWDLTTDNIKGEAPAEGTYIQVEEVDEDEDEQEVEIKTILVQGDYVVYQEVETEMEDGKTERETTYKVYNKPADFTLEGTFKEVKDQLKDDYIFKVEFEIEEDDADKELELKFDNHKYQYNGTEWKLKK